MTQIADATVTGFAKSPRLVAPSFAPLRQLRSEGLLRHIHYVTWDSTDLDSFVAPQRGTHTGRMMRSVERPFGRLMDDDWQDAIFSKPMPDFPRDTLASMLEHITQSHDGRLNDLESSFYGRLRAFKASHAHLLSAKNRSSPGISSGPARTVPTPIVQGAAA